jgi:hypothetical protein
VPAVGPVVVVVLVCVGVIVVEAATGFFESISFFGVLIIIGVDVVVICVIVDIGIFIVVVGIAVAFGLVVDVHGIAPGRVKVVVVVVVGAAAGFFYYICGFAVDVIGVVGDDIFLVDIVIVVVDSFNVVLVVLDKIFVLIDAVVAWAAGAARVVAAAHLQRQGGRQVNHLAVLIVVLKKKESHL